jgi:DnaK suppressor protein
LNSDQAKEKLRARLDELSRLSAMTSESRKTVELDQQAVGRLSRMDAMQGQAMALATEERRESERVRIEAALRRIETGDFGYCVKCGEKIEPKRLKHDPSQPLCLNCAKGLS